MIGKILIIGLLILAVYLGILLRNLWISFRHLLKAAHGFGAAFSTYATPHIKDYVSESNIYEEKERARQARRTRREIKDLRDSKRQGRLVKATNRWDTQIATDYDRFDETHREAARAIREKNKK